MLQNLMKYLQEVSQNHITTGVIVIIQIIIITIKTIKDIIIEIINVSKYFYNNFYKEIQQI